MIVHADGCAACVATFWPCAGGGQIPFFRVLTIPLPIRRQAASMGAAVSSWMFGSAKRQNSREGFCPERSALG